MEMLNISKSNVSNELNKSKEDNEELKFQVSATTLVARRWEVDRLYDDLIIFVFF